MFAWCCLGKRQCTGKEGKRARSVSLEIGPKYDGGPTSTEESHETEPLNEKERISGAYDESGSPSKYSLHGSVYKPDQSSLWLERAPSTSTREGRVWPSSDPSYFEDDPFIVPPSRAASAATTGSFFADDNHAPYSTAQRHQSTRRNLVQRIPSGTKRTPEHCDMEYEDIPLDRNYSFIARNADGVALPEKSYSSPSKERQLRKLDDEADQTEWAAGTVFRPAHEDADDTQNHLSRLSYYDDNQTPPATRPSASGQSPVADSPGFDEVEKPDIYTVLPKRITRTPTKTKDGPSTPMISRSNSRDNEDFYFKTTNTPTPKPRRKPSTQRTENGGTPLYHTPTHHPILPSSPPLITSPPLESELLFCSPFLPPTELPSSRTPPADPVGTRTKTPAPERQTKKVIYSPRPLPAPFASSPEFSSYRTLLGTPSTDSNQDGESPTVTVVQSDILVKSAKPYED